MRRETSATAQPPLSTGRSGTAGAAGAKPVRVLRDPFVADVFADAVTQLEHVNGTVRVEFAIFKPSEPPSTTSRQLVQVARIVLPDIVAQRLSLALYDYLKKQGLDPTALVSKGTTGQ